MLFGIKIPKSYAVKYCIIMTSKLSFPFYDLGNSIRDGHMLLHLFLHVQGVLQHKLSKMHRRELLL